VLSGTTAAGNVPNAAQGRPAVVVIKSRSVKKAALIRRAAAELVFVLKVFLSLTRRLQRNDIVLTVTAPFALPYAVVAAAWLKGARSALILHDLFPDVLIIAGLLKPKSVGARFMRGLNTLMFGALDAVVTIGRDVERPLLAYGGMIKNKIHFIPNWTTLSPWVRPIRADNPFRQRISARYVVGLSGNLGFTHDPEIVFEAARSMREQKDIHFLLSGWGIGFERLRQLQSESNLQNVTLIGRVADEDLEQFLSAADVWIIPYRTKVAGVSVPSRFYNLLAVGRPVILVSDAEAEAALIVRDNNVGWVVSPGSADYLAKAIRAASSADDLAIRERAVVVAGKFSFEAAMTSYAELVDQLFRKSKNY
jgi:colanic acid biosynthesis glycosyl transferase WcaI